MVGREWRSGLNGRSSGEGRQDIETRMLDASSEASRTVNNHEGDRAKDTLY